MLSYSELKPVVEGVARQYSKDLVNGRGFNYQTYQDLSQDLWLKAYEIIGEYENAPINFVAKCLWNYATDKFRSSMNQLSNETLFDNSTFSISQDSETSSSYIPKNLRDAIVSQSESKSENDELVLSDLVDMVLSYAKSENKDIYKYVVIKLKMSGYVDESFEKDINMDEFEKSHPDLDCSQDQYILRELFGFSEKCSKTGGSGSFKAKKKNFRELLLNLLDVEDLYPTWYEVTYIDSNGVPNSKWFKALNENDASRKAKSSIKDLVKIVSVIGE